jgi:hypothetical protein
LYWLLGLNSKLFTSNKLFIYKTILKPILTYGIQLWGMASTSNIEILESFQSKVLHMIVDVPWHVPNTVIQRDLQIPTYKMHVSLPTSTESSFFFDLLSYVLSVSVWSGFAIQPAHCTVSLKNLTAASISSSVLRETFKVNLWLMRCLKSPQFVCLLLKLGCYSWFSACAVSVIKTRE